MSKEYVMQLESTIENYKRDNKILKEELFKYRELEENLGCSLEVLEKALNNGIYTNVYSGLCIVSRYKDVLDVSDDYGVYIKDYKKTWWLKADKSE